MSKKEQAERAFEDFHEGGGPEPLGRGALAIFLAERDGAVCFYCGADLMEAGLAFDHARPIARGGVVHCSSAYRLSCKRCNGKKNAFWGREELEALEKRNPGRRFMRALEEVPGPHVPVQDAEWDYKHEAVQKGWCVSYGCGRPRAEGRGTYCDLHADKHKSQVARRQEKLMVEGTCPYCGQRPLAEGRGGRCDQCADASNRQGAERAHRLMAEGTCPYCGQRPLAEGRGGRCDQCADANNERILRRAHRLMAEGTCVDCGKPKGPDATKWYCRTCTDKRNKAKRRKRREAKARKDGGT